MSFLILTRKILLPVFALTAGALLIPFAADSRNSAKSIADSTHIFVLDVRTGRRSDIAARILPELGYHTFVNITGGIQAWKAAGYATVTGPVGH